jgi:membrane protein
MAVSRARLAKIEAALGHAVDELYGALRRNRVTRMPWAVIQTFSEGQGALLSGSMAYYTFLSLLPLLMIGGFVLGALSQGSPLVHAALIDAVERVFPGANGREILNQLIGARATFGILGFLTLSYAASGFVGALTASLNRMWEVPAGRNPVGQKVVNMLVVIILGTVLLGSAALTIWVAYVTRGALENLPVAVVRNLELPFSLLSLFFVLLVLYRVLPARRLRWRSQVPGAAFGALSVEFLKRVFAFWAQHSAGIAALPRSILSVVLLLVWLGLLGQLILYGAAINVVADRRRRGADLFPP